MRFAFTDDQLLFRDAVRDLLTKECPPEVRARSLGHRCGSLARSVERRSPTWACVGLTVPEADGGLGYARARPGLLLEETGRAALPEPIVETTAAGAAAPGRVRPRWCRGEWLAAHRRRATQSLTVAVDDRSRARRRLGRC